MAAEKSSSEPDEDDKKTAEHPNGGKDKSSRQATAGDEEDEEEDEEEPRLKYAPLTKNLSALYRNGDASSAFIVGGDKLIVGTHNGNIHVLTLPTLQSLRFYHAHSASVSAISISPFPPPLPTARPESVARLAQPQQSVKGHGRSPSTSSDSPQSKNGSKSTNIPLTPSNQIYIATSSIDGNVCVSSLVDSRDVQLRNFGRPVQAVALSPEYKSDRIYLSGGLAGSLVLTTGGQIGKSTNATTTGAAAAASGWLGTIGLSASTGTDKVLHTGEGTISTIKWSLSGKYILWVNEEGIKIMRSHLHLESADSSFEWKRVNHIPRPNLPGWEEMAGVWKPRAEWIDRDNLETEDDSALETINSIESNGRAEGMLKNVAKKNKPEEAVVGWGGTIWIINVFPGGAGTGKNVGERNIGRVEIATILRTECIISGISLYTPNLLLVLAYMEPEEDSPAANDTPTKRGRHHRQNALEPELRLIDISVKPEEEVSADTLTISRYEGLSASDYNLGVLPPTKIPAALLQRGTLETISSGVWDAALYPTRMFSSGASVKSSGSSEERGTAVKAPSGSTTAQTARAREIQDVATTSGMKIFIFSPYDCVVAVKRDLSDRVAWLSKMGRHQQAWELLDEHPEAAGTAVTEPSGTSSPRSLTHGGSRAPDAPNGPSLAEFFADSTSIMSVQNPKNINSTAEKEKRRIGEQWLQQLVSAGEWSTAGDVAGKVIGTSSRWEHWALLFIRNKKFDEITPHIPTFQITPPLPSMVYEMILGHYVLSDRIRFRELLDLWPTDLFDISSITAIVEGQLADIAKQRPDWRILKECLAKLFIAEGRYEDALRCYIQLQDADTALTLIKETHLLAAISDDIPGLILLRVPQQQLEDSSVAELELVTSEPMKLLVDAARTGTVTPETVVVQLEESNHLRFLYIYFKTLWKGESHREHSTSHAGIGRFAAASLAADEGKAMVDEFANSAVELFADYDRDLLMDFLHSSTAYTFDTAVRICERKHYIPELVYLLSTTGQTKKALFLIINDLQDVSQAITFAKEQNDPDLWDDLLEYSMSRPKFIEGLLSEVGTAIDPITLVKRIPSGLEVEGLREGLKKMIREYDLQDSISTGVAKVLQGEVAVGMETLRKGRNRGLRFDVEDTTFSDETAEGEGEPVERKLDSVKPGHCVGCGRAFHQDESEPLIIFACSHSWHIAHLLDDSSTWAPSQDDDSAPYIHSTLPRTVGPKVTTARLLRDKIELVGGCRICRKQREREAEVG